MTEQEVSERVLRRITGNKVCSELDPVDAIAFVHDAFLEVLPWFDEPDKVATFLVSKVQERAGWIDLSSLDPPAKKVRQCVPIRLERDYTGDIVRDLLLLPASPLDSRSIIEQTYWNMTWPQVKNLLGRDLRFKYNYAEKRLYVDEVLEPSLTVFWVPEIQTLGQITYQKALTWIFEMATAFTMEALAHVRGKFTGGAMRFETDASEMLSTANERQRELREQLRDLQFTLAIR